MTGLLRQDEAFLEEKTAEILQKSAVKNGFDCEILRNAPDVLRHRAIRQLLEIPKPAMVHVEQVERLLAEEYGSASIALPGGITAIREYGILRFQHVDVPPDFPAVTLCGGEEIAIPTLGLRVSLRGPLILESETDDRAVFAINADTVSEFPTVTVRPRQTGDRLRLPGGTKTLKKWMIDRKIPAARRGLLPVLEDPQGILAVYQMGCDMTRKAHTGQQAWIIQFHDEERKTDAG